MKTVNLSLKTLTYVIAALSITSCVSKKKMTQMEQDYEKQLTSNNEELNKYKKLLSTCDGDLRVTQNTVKLKDEKIVYLKDLLEDSKKLRDKQVTQVGDMAVLSQSANENIKETLSQLEKKDKYIQLLYAAKTKADSINLALAVNLKSELKDGIDDKDVEIKVDKTVVFINLSDKVLYKSGSADLTPKAIEILGKIAKIVESRPDFEVMVEGYTDNDPISTSCIKDNWDLSVKRSTSVVRVLQDDYKIDPNRLIAAGRGQYNALASNDTDEGKSTNRRTRIIILPKLNQFYDLLNPNMAKKLD